MSENAKFEDSKSLSHLKEGETWLSPLKIQKLVTPDADIYCNPLIFNYLQQFKADAYLKVTWSKQTYEFILQPKAKFTPQSIRIAIDETRKIVDEANKNGVETPFGELFPAIQVPFLSPSSLALLEEEQISGVDKCGNGVVIVPERVLLLRSGAPNAYPDIRTTSNPYSKKSSLVGRTLLNSSRWETLSELVQSITQLGGKVSLAQASKALKSIEEDLIAKKSSKVIELIDPVGLIKKLADKWNPDCRKGIFFKLGEQKHWALALASIKNLNWAVSGESSATRYASFAQTGPIRVMVDNLAAASDALKASGATPSTVPSFADLELWQSNDPGFYFDTRVDEEGIRWSSPLQSYLELQAGDARQKEVASDLRQKLLNTISK
ncbi:MAG: hypothetical protein ACPGFB_16315 [Verrucomicrobiales bacterium]